MNYTQENTLQIAKRYKNTKRTYLLVNPLQGKHIPVSPTAALDMMTALGQKLYRQYSKTKLIIGFAETATAIGAAVADCFGEDCIYIHTTREEIEGVENWIFFSEEHSHAVEQKLCADRLIPLFEQSPYIIFVDDELSTGKTLINIVEQLRRQYPILQDKKMIVASILNRLTEENTNRLTAANITAEYLVKLPEVDYTTAVANIEVEAAQDFWNADCEIEDYTLLPLQTNISNPRLGVSANMYKTQCRYMAQQALQLLLKINGKSVLVLGTEECMYPALVLGQTIEEQKVVRTVRCHATTRSPIGICTKDNYPIFEGYKIHSFYETERETFIYDVAKYDVVLIVTDTKQNDTTAIRNLTAVLKKHNCGKIFLINISR